jgi:hypothetical protein
MTSLAFMECCQRLAVTPKTLRQWLAQAEMSLHPHPTDARITCLTSEQLHLLAALHGRVLHPSGNPLGSSGLGSGEITDVDLRARLVQLEAHVTTLQAQLTDLSLQLLREREQRTEQRLLALEAQVSRTSEPLPPPSARSVSFEQAKPSVAHHASRQRTRLIPLIEYGAGGQYVLICPKEGEQHVLPDTPRVVCLAGNVQLVPLHRTAGPLEHLSQSWSVLLDGLSPYSWTPLRVCSWPYGTPDHSSPRTDGCYPPITRSHSLMN